MPAAESIMADNSASAASAWIDGHKITAHKELSSDLRTDICIVGAGIAGLSVAYLLSREGKSVVVLEAGHIGFGETSRTTGHLSNALDDRYSELERLFGRDGAARAQQSHWEAIGAIEQIVDREQIECDFTRLDGYLFASPGQPLDELESELNAARRAGIGGVAPLDN